MKISDYLKEELLYLDVRATTKKEVINEIGNFMKKAKEITNYDEFIKGIFDREEVCSTGIGEGLAIPHTRTDAVSDFVICVARTRKKVDFESLDKQPIKLIFMVGIPKENVNQYLQVLACLTRLLKNKGFVETLLEVKDTQAVIETFKKVEE